MNLPDLLLVLMVRQAAPAALWGAWQCWGFNQPTRQCYWSVCTWIVHVKGLETGTIMKSICVSLCHISSVN